MANTNHNQSQPVFMPDKQQPRTLLRVGPNLEERQRLDEQAKAAAVAANVPQGRYRDGRYAPKGTENVVFRSRLHRKPEKEDHSVAKVGIVSFIGLAALSASIFGSTPSHDTAKAPEKVVFQAPKPQSTTNEHVAQVQNKKEQTTIFDPSKLQAVENGIVDATSKVTLGAQKAPSIVGSILQGLTGTHQESQEQTTTSTHIDEATHSAETVFTPELEKKANAAYIRANAWTRYKDGHDLAISKDIWNKLYLDYRDELNKSIPDWFQSDQTMSKHTQPGNTPTAPTIQLAHEGPGVSQVPVMPENVPGVTNQEFIDALNNEVLPITRAAGIPDAVVAAQAAVESGYGTSAAAKGNNWFGLMGWDADGKRYLRSFDTIQDGTRYYVATVKNIIQHNTGEDVTAFKTPIEVLEALQGQIKTPTSSKKMQRYEGDDKVPTQYIHDVTNTPIYVTYGGGQVMTNNPWDTSH